MKKLYKNDEFADAKFEVTEGKAELRQTWSI